MSGQTTSDFQKIVWEYYARAGRHDLPWRRPAKNGAFDPYAIMVSELMLQQTQVPRVLPKFEIFMRTFPTFESLAAAPLGDVLRAWNGLGYNRRAKFLWQTAGMVTREFGGQLPSDHAALIALPGIGPNTAGAILAYAFNAPAIFVETNIRSVFIHHFFAGETGVGDKQIIAQLERSLTNVAEPRAWYWALMDYGTYLKQTSGNAARASATYARQSKFEGSRRQVRGQVLRALGKQSQTLAQMRQHITDERLPEVLDDLLRENLIQKPDRTYALA